MGLENLSEKQLKYELMKAEKRLSKNRATLKRMQEKVGEFRKEYIAYSIKQVSELKQEINSRSTFRRPVLFGYYNQDKAWRNMEILKLRKTGSTYTEIARNYGITVTRARDIVLRLEMLGRNPSNYNVAYHCQVYAQTIFDAMK